jgi:hypothetical protein
VYYLNLLDPLGDPDTPNYDWGQIPAEQYMAQAGEWANSQHEGEAAIASCGAGMAGILWAIHAAECESADGYSATETISRLTARVNYCLDQLGRVAELLGPGGA